MFLILIGFISSSLIGFITALAMANVRISDLEKENLQLKRKLSGNSFPWLSDNTIIEHAQILVTNQLKLKV